MGSTKWTNDPVSVLSRNTDLLKEAYELVLMGKTAVYTERDTNEIQFIQNDKRRELTRLLFSTSGFATSSEYEVNGNTLTFLKTQKVHINGDIFTIPAGTQVQLPSAPVSGIRTDLLMFETWKEEVVYDSPSPAYGLEGQVSNESFEDPRATALMKEQTSRIALRSRLRFVQGVDFSSYPKGVNDPNKVFARGGATLNTSYTFIQSNEDKNLFIAGDGSPTAKSALKTFDGYVQAICVFRLNQVAGDPITMEDIVDIRDVAATLSNKETGDGAGAIPVRDEHGSITVPTPVLASHAANKSYVDEQITLVTSTGVPKLVSYPITMIATQNNQTDFEIPLETFNDATDTLILSQNTTVLTPERYTVLEGTKTLRLTTPVSNGTVISGWVLKNVPIGPDGAIQGSVLAVESVPVNRVQGLAKELATYREKKLDRDALGIYRVTELRRVPDDTLFERSELSNPDANGYYQTLTVTEYDLDGTTVVKTETFTLVNDADGNVIDSIPNGVS
jgi:hypothetical protein